MKIFVNGAQREVSEGATVAALLSELNVTARHVAVEVNLQLVPRDRHDACGLHEADRLEIVTLVGGG